MVLGGAFCAFDCVRCRRIEAKCDNIGYSLCKIGGVTGTSCGFDIIIMNSYFNLSLVILRGFPRATGVRSEVFT